MGKCISYNEIEELCEALIRDYIKRKNYRNMFCVDIEGFITEYLGARIEYESFAEEDQNKVGFLSDGKTKLKIWRAGKIVEVIYPKDTVVIEKILQGPGESGRKRFTIAHEGAHLILQRHCSMKTQAYFHSDFDSEAECSPAMMKDLFDLYESYANRGAACLLMPGFLMADLIVKYNRGAPVKIYGSNILAERERLLIQKMADTAGVSYTALFNRTRELKLLEYRSMDEYLASNFYKEGRGTGR